MDLGKQELSAEYTTIHTDYKECRLGSILYKPGVDSQAKKMSFEIARADQECGSSKKGLIELPEVLFLRLTETNTKVEDLRLSRSDIKTSDLWIRVL